MSQWVQHCMSILLQKCTGFSHVNSQTFVTYTENVFFSFSFPHPSYLTLRLFHLSYFISRLQLNISELVSPMSLLPETFVHWKVHQDFWMYYIIRMVGTIIYFEDSMITVNPLIVWIRLITVNCLVKYLWIYFSLAKGAYFDFKFFCKNSLLWLSCHEVITIIFGQWCQRQVLFHLLSSMYSITSWCLNSYSLVFFLLLIIFTNFFGELILIEISISKFHASYALLFHILYGRLL